MTKFRGKFQCNRYDQMATAQQGKMMDKKQRNTIYKRHVYDEVTKTMPQLQPISSHLTPTAHQSNESSRQTFPSTRHVPSQPRPKIISFVRACTHPV